ncbi:MAG: metal ABC transporter permease [Alphaproteobacteria bacterium GM202ARS2]|nr:metal ABC transporter permease [Alphaproteobacteria bacterium GM202ARS2]
MTDSVFLAVHYNVIVVLVTASLSGGLCGLIGVLGVMRGYSLVSDALAHATLPGLALGFLLVVAIMPESTLTPPFFWLLLGAGLTASLALLSIQWITRNTPLSSDSAIASVLAFFFAVGVALLGIIQELDAVGQAGIERFLLGNLATTTFDEAVVVTGLACFVFTTFLVLKKEMFALCFDPLFCATQRIEKGAPLMPIFLLLATVSGIQTIGLILLVALLTLPAACGMVLQLSFYRLLVFASLQGASASALGGLISYLYEGLPSGALIVLILSAQFASLVVWRLVTRTHTPPPIEPS